jgi:hypothetical protein
MNSDNADTEVVTTLIRYRFLTCLNDHFISGANKRKSFRMAFRLMQQELRVGITRDTAPDKLLIGNLLTT